MIRNDALIRRKFYQYLMPGVLMVVAMQLGNVVDGMFVGHALSYNAVSAISLSIPALYAMQFLPFLLGTGGAAVAAVAFGKQQIEKASRVYTLCLAVGLAVSFLPVVLAPVLCHPLAQWMASSEELAALLEPYLLIYMLGNPVLTLAIEFSYFISVDNHPKLGSALFIIANIVNLILDYVFLFHTSLGMYGSALSTILGYAAGLAVLLPYLRSNTRLLHLTSLAKARLAELWEASRAGLSSAMYLLASGANLLLLNSLVLRMLGQSQMAYFSVCRNSCLLVELVVGGILGLIPTIAGVLYGEKDFYGLRKLAERVMKSAAIVVLLLIAVFWLFPSTIAGLFGVADPEMLRVLNVCLQLYSLNFLPYVIDKFLQNYYQATLFSSLATLGALMQRFLAIAPISILLMFCFGIYGVCIAPLFAELLTIAVVCAVRIAGQKKGTLPQKGVLMIPEQDLSVYIDCSILGTPQEITDASQQMVDFCEKNGISKRDSMAVGLAVEEICANIMEYGYTKKPDSIDICLSHAENRLILRIRDDGPAFDPVAYAMQENADPMGGICLITRMASQFKYLRTLNFNNTIIEINL